ncbi:hypothetical protein D9M70_576650 [compost metagenome]
MSVISRPAMVFHGGGRRWFTLRAACKAEANALIRTKCECESIDHGPLGWEHLTCWYHEPNRYPRIFNRLFNGYMRRFKAQQEKTP